eukprot:scaffold4247_cov60-Phaeocystis_antarctica.AAC.4
MATERALHAGSLGGPKIIEGQRATISAPTCRPMCHARRSDSALEYWYGSKPGPSRRETVFQSSAQ